MMEMARIGIIQPYGRASWVFVIYMAFRLHIAYKRSKQTRGILNATAASEMNQTASLQVFTDAIGSSINSQSPYILGLGQLVFKDSFHRAALFSVKRTDPVPFSSTNRLGDYSVPQQPDIGQGKHLLLGFVPGDDPPPIVFLVRSSLESTFPSGEKELQPMWKRQGHRLNV
ncbi:hypothetical protein ACRALDRAFT_2017638 [Sodiomyces alcalophilus JCM 7366]|uniref:uncharacterized protein n=1 Tax=Sodiomyces alcalophilus JCM 7366 TaxID=591952 RepID=UPI0039B5BF01